MAEYTDYDLEVALDRRRRAKAERKAFLRRKRVTNDLIEYLKENPGAKAQLKHLLDTVDA